jgi:DinB superfamily
MDANVPADIRELQGQLEAAERDAEALVAGLSQEQGTRRPEAGSWSVSECLDHLATGNRVYLRAMQEPANRARTRGRLRWRPAKPGLVGRLVVSTFEPPPRWWSRRKSPRSIRPRSEPPLAETFASFVASQADFQAFLRVNADLDLAGIRFPNPFIRGIRFSLATGLHLIAAHERRHLWQAWRVRRTIERAHE